jgi:hypothetical protein
VIFDQFPLRLTIPAAELGEAVCPKALRGCGESMLGKRLGRMLASLDDGYIFQDDCCSIQG